MSSRTFSLQSPHMHGDDIRAWQETLLNQLRHRWGWKDVPLVIDGDYGMATRTWTGAVLYGLGIPQDAMKEGVTPELRIKVRNRDLSPDDRRRYKKRQTWRKKKKRQFTGGAVARPVNKIIEDSWGYHPGVHDGVDIITPPDPAIYAICDATVVRVSDDWWGLGSPGGALADRGDGIIIIRASNDVGPIRKGDNICYGHAEHPAVHVGQHVQAGHRIGHAGFANAWHIHFMVNHRSDTKGVGDRDPRPVIDYVVKHG